MPMSETEKASMEGLRNTVFDCRETISVLRSTLQFTGTDIKSLESAVKELSDENTLLRERIARLESFREAVEKNSLTIPGVYTLMVAAVGVASAIIIGLLNYFKK